MQNKRVFEFGSGFGQSSFWWFQGRSSDQFAESLILTERNAFWRPLYEKVPWPSEWRKRCDYRQGDAFDVLEQLDKRQEKIDVCFIDGEKAQYREFIERALRVLAEKGMMIVDNAFWKGSFLSASLGSQTRRSSRAIAELHRWLLGLNCFHVAFLPIGDGLFVLRKRPVGCSDNS